MLAAMKVAGAQQIQPNLLYAFTADVCTAISLMRAGAHDRLQLGRDKVHADRISALGYHKFTFTFATLAARLTRHPFS